MGNPKILGITGGVGCGKSTVLDFLEQEYQAQVIQADLVARQLMEPGQAVFQKVVERFGEDILTDGQINRPLLGQIVFQNEEKRILLNSLTHPAVKEEILRQIQESKAHLVVIEAALLLEDHYDAICDEIWYIYASEPVRMERLMASRGYTKERCLDMFRSQLPENRFRSQCQRVIDNNGDMEKTRKQIRDALTDSFLQDTKRYDRITAGGKQTE
jgi:dephospho-CoA kinase